MASFGNQGGGFYAGTNWGNPYGGRYYSPSGVLTGNTGLKGASPLDAVAELAYASQSGGDTIGSYGDGPTSGGGRSQGAGPVVGALSSMGIGFLGSQAGLPGYISGPLGSLAGKAVGKGEITNHDLATISLGTLAKGLAPAVFANPAVAIGLGLAGLLGFNPFSEVVDFAGRTLGIPGIMSEKGQFGYYDAPEDHAYPGLEGDAAQAVSAVNESYGDRQGFSEALDSMGPLGDAPMSGSWSSESDPGGFMGGSLGDAPSAGSWSDTSTTSESSSESSSESDGSGGGWGGGGFGDSSGDASGDSSWATGGTVRRRLSANRTARI